MANFCVVTSSPKFQALSKKLNVSEHDLEIAILHSGKPLDSNDKNQEKEILKYLNIGTTFKVDNKTDLYKYNKILTNLKQDLYNVSEEDIPVIKRHLSALDIPFSVYQDSKGKYVVATAVPVLKQKSPVLGTNVSLDSSMIDYYYSKVKETNPYHLLFKQLVDILRKSNIPIIINTSTTSSDPIARRRRDGFKTATITFNEEKLVELLKQDEVKNAEGFILRVLTHELVHALTAELLVNERALSNISNYSEIQQNFVSNISVLYNEVKEALKEEDYNPETGEGWYGLKNVREFVSELLTNRDFQLRLSEIKSKKEKSFFEKFTDLITQLFTKIFEAQGIQIKNTVLEDALSITEEYFQSFSPELNNSIHNKKGEDSLSKKERNGALYSLHRLAEKIERDASSPIRIIYKQEYATIKGKKVPTKRTFRIVAKNESFWDMPNAKDRVFKYLGERLSAYEVKNMQINNYFQQGENFRFMEISPKTDKIAKGNVLLEQYVEDLEEKEIKEKLAEEAILKEWEEEEKKQTKLEKEKQLSENNDFFESPKGLNKGKAIVDRIKADSKRRIEKRRGGTFVDGKKAELTVTGLWYKQHPEELNEEEENAKNAWFKVAGPLGTITDIITREYFQNKLKKVYPNFSDKQLSDLKQDLDNLVKFFDQKFKGPRGEAYEIVTDEFPIAGTYTIVENGKPKTYTITGVMDMLVYDKEGNFYIYDMKALHSWSSEKKQMYTQQLQLYKSILEANYPELKGKIKETKLITFNLDYDAPIGAIDKEGNPIGILEYRNAHEFENNTEDFKQLYSRNPEFDNSYQRIQDTEGYRAPRLNYVETIEDCFKDLPTEYDTHIGSLTSEEKGELSEEIGTKTATEKKIVPTNNSLYNNPLISASERRFLANYVMNSLSNLITQIYTNPARKKQYLGENFADTDFSLMSRQEMIKKIGIGTLFNIIKERVLNPTNHLSSDFTTLSKLKLAYDNFDTLRQIGYARLIALEGIVINDNVVSEEINTGDLSPEIQQDLEAVAQEEHEREYWQMNLRFISARSSLSAEIRRVFEKLPALDVLGNPILDSFGFGLPTFVDSDVAVNTILKLCQDCTTMSEMERVLTRQAPNNPWLYSILNKIKEEPFRSMFFQNFRKDFSNYSIIRLTYDKEGNRQYVVEMINTSSASKGILNSIVATFKAGKSPLMKNVYDTIEGRGRVNAEKVSSILKDLHKIEEELSNAFSKNNKTFNKVLSDNIETINSVLSQIGIYLDSSVLRGAFSKDSFSKNYSTTTVGYVLSETASLLDTMNDHRDEIAYSPVAKGEEGNVYGNYKNILKVFDRFLPEQAEASVYENGKMHYSYQVPSYMGKLMLNLKDSIKDSNKFSEFIEKNYANTRWFYEDSESGSFWRNVWLEKLVNSRDAREAFQHKVQLSFNGVPYNELSSAAYQLSLIHEFFYDKVKSKYAWYRLPILANKPSSEFIRFIRYSGTDYKKRILKGFAQIFDQEVLRIQTVLDRAVNPNVEVIGSKDKSSFDIDSKILTPELKKKIKNKTLTLSDVIKDGKFIFAPYGASFKFLQALNNEFVQKTELGQQILDYIQGKEQVSTSELIANVKESIEEYMDKVVEKELQNYKNLGLFDTTTRQITVTKKDAKTSKRIKEKKEVSEYTYLSKLGKDEESISAALENYIWNDMFATANIIQLTTTDLAYYRNVEDFQKRYAQVHSPGMRLNTEAVDFNGVLYSDGFERTMYLEDDIIVSEIIPNITKVFKEKIKGLKGAEKQSMEIMTNAIISELKKVNVDDAQAFDSPTAYRKKMAMQGKWDNTMEEAYARIRKGNWNVQDLGVVWQPKKPFVYTQLFKNSGSNAIDTLKVPVQNKNSEYLIMLAEAIMRGTDTGKVNRLSAIAEFMEESAYDNGEYNGRGIDTIQFLSAVNVGRQGAININNLNTKEEIKQALRDAAYVSDKDNVEDPYNEQYVHAIPFEDYAIQQEVPAHFQDHKQPMGSQIRILSISDITPGTQFSVYTRNGNKKMSDVELTAEYKNLIAENIKDSLKQLEKRFKINGTRKERNEALSKILKEAIYKDVRYGDDLARACSLDENGEFVIPPSDPIQSIRIQQLINSIIKNTINKQDTNGGPLVQATCWGLSEQLHIRYQNKEGKILATEEEFNNNIVPAGGFEYNKSDYSSYQEYVNKNQESLAYYESYATIPTKALERKLLKEDGTMYTPQEAVQKGIIPEEMLKAIGYRIPTEDKYSMFPIKIVGFLPKAAGEAIMLPAELTTISGSDFDIDKMYVMIKEFNEYTSTNKSLLVNHLKKVVDALVEMGEISKEERPSKVEIARTATRLLDEEAFKEIQEGNNKFLKAALGVYLKDKYKYHTVGYRELNDKDNPRSIRNNKIFNIQWSVLTNKDTLNKMFNPGSFDVQKLVARKVQLLQRGYSYKDVQNKSLEELESLIENSEKLDILVPSTQVYFFEQNMTAGKLIGIFANNNTSHAFLSTQNISLDLHKNSFAFAGITVSDNSHNKLDNLQDLQGGLISKTIASYLAASVDAVKDPVLNFLNLNTLTANPAMLLTRLGFSVESVGLFLNQPIIRDFTNEYLKRNNEGYVSVNDLVTEFLEKAKADILTLTTTLKTEKFEIEDMANEISSFKRGEDYTDFQLRSLLLFSELEEKSQDLQTITFLTKFNSISNAVGPSIADTLVLEERYRKFIDKMNSIEAPFNKDVVHVIEVDPILNAFYSSTLGEEGAAKKILGEYFPHYTDRFQSILERFRESTKLAPDTKVINKLLNDYLFYKLTSGNDPVLPMNLENRKYYINDFVQDFLKAKVGITDNSLLNIVRVMPRTEKCEVETLEASTGGYSIDAQEKIKDSWSNLMINPNTTDLGTKLFYYNLIRSGFGFSPKTFAHLATVDVKLGIPKYLNAIVNPTYADNDISVSSFLTQFRRNNWRNTRIVPELKYNKSLEISENSDIAKNKYIEIKFKNKGAVQNIIIKETLKGTVYAPMIRYEDELYYLKTGSSRSVYYYKISPLGNTNNFLEYNANDAADMKSVFNNNIGEEANVEAGIYAEENVPKIKNLVNSVISNFGEHMFEINSNQEGAGPKFLAEQVLKGLNISTSPTFIEKMINRINEIMETNNNC